MTVTGFPSRRMDLPTMSRSPAKAPLPESVVEHGRPRRIEATFRLVEDPPEVGPNAKQREKRLRNGNAGQALRLAAAREADVTRGVELKEAGDSLERPALLSKLDEVRYLNCLCGEVLRRAVGDPDQPVRVGERKWAKQERLTETEDGRAGSDPEPDDRDAEHRGAPVEAQGPKRVADIVGDIQHGTPRRFEPRDWTARSRRRFRCLPGYLGRLVC